jgi:hypothetical protein
VRFVGRILGILVGVALIGGLVWYNRYAPWAEKYPDPRVSRVVLSEPVSSRMKKEADAKAKQEREEANQAARPEPGRPPVAAKPPFPKAVVDERLYEFGTMQVLDEGKHRFRIENKGEGPLSLANPWSAGSPWKREVAPGKSTEYEMVWRTAEPTTNYAKTVTLWTSDPKLPEVQLKVQGRMVAPVHVEPSGEWKVPPLKGDKDGKFAGKIGSDIESSFRIVSIKTTSPKVKVDTRPLTTDELRAAEMKSGYALIVTVDKGIPDGVFQSELTVTTTLKGGETTTIKLTALQLR